MRSTHHPEAINSLRLYFTFHFHLYSKDVRRKCLSFPLPSNHHHPRAPVTLQESFGKKQQTKCKPMQNFHKLQLSCFVVVWLFQSRRSRAVQCTEPQPITAETKPKPHKRKINTIEKHNFLYFEIKFSFPFAFVERGDNKRAT